MIKILVIEDESILRDEVVEWLSLEGYEAVSAADGIAGVEAALRERPDLIVCDVMMPHLDGYGVLIELRSDSRTMNTPFIFLTARADHDDIRKGMSLGADDYITKPFKRLDLLEAIRSRLDKQAAQELKHQQELALLHEGLMQEREQRLLKSKVVAMFSHDFRNPLTSILTSNTLLRDYADRLDETRRRSHLNRIEAAVQQLIQMLDDMMLVAQMESGALDFHPEPLNLVQLFQRLVDEFQTSHRTTHHLRLNNYCDKGIKADSRLLRQIASNLISNAIKYSPEGKEIIISLGQSDDDFTLRVEDHGIGIPEEEQQRLFETFQRGSNVGPITGTGLGLAIVKQAVDIHGGSISVESEVGRGTTITVTLPAQPMHLVEN